MMIVILTLMVAISRTQDIYEVSLECSDICEQGKNNHCNGKCIKFSIQDVEVPPQDLTGEECWKLSTCAGFPKTVNFRHTGNCKAHCGVNFHSYSSDDTTYYMDVCVEEFHEDNPLPNIC